MPVGSLHAVQVGRQAKGPADACHIGVIIWHLDIPSMWPQPRLKKSFCCVSSLSAGLEGCPAPPCRPLFLGAFVSTFVRVEWAWRSSADPWQTARPTAAAAGPQIPLDAGAKLHCGSRCWTLTTGICLRQPVHYVQSSIPCNGIVMFTIHLPSDVSAETTRKLRIKHGNQGPIALCDALRYFAMPTGPWASLPVNVGAYFAETRDRRRQLWKPRVDCTLAVSATLDFITRLRLHHRQGRHGASISVLSC